MTMTLETLLLLQRLLDAQQLQVGDPEFAETVKAVLKAKKELAAALANTTDAPLPEPR